MKHAIVATVLAAAYLLVVQQHLEATDCVTIKKPLRGEQVCGHVADVSGKPIARAEIELLNSRSEVVSESGADDGGDFVMPDVSKGEYKIVVRASGFASSNEQPLVVTKSNQNTRCHKPFKVVLNVGTICNAFSK